MFFGVDKPVMLERLNQAIIQAVPFNAALRLSVEDFDDGVAIVRLPYRLELVGNPTTGVLHGGMVTSLIDATCGLAVFMKLRRMMRIATLDLRIDYLKPATPPLDVRARAECYKVTRQVAFTRAIAYHEDPDDPIASSAGTFMLFDDTRSPVGKALAGNG
jgi:uncharacterized protein (TIGR00369 family)